MALKKNIYKATLPFVALLFLSCSSDNAEFAKLELTVPRPIVQDYDTSFFVDADGDGIVDEGETTPIQQPWILVDPSVVNNLDQTITVNTLRFTISGNSGGSVVSKIYTLDPTEISANRRILGELLAGESSDRTSPAPCTTTIPCSFASWFLDDLPVIDPGNIYVISVEIIGHLGAEFAQDSKPIDKVISLATQPSS